MSISEIPGRRRVITDAIMADIARRKSAGESSREIAKLIGCHPTSVDDAWRKYQGLPRRGHGRKRKVPKVAQSTGEEAAFRIAAQNSCNSLLRALHKERRSSPAMPATQAPPPTAVKELPKPKKRGRGSITVGPKCMSEIKSYADDAAAAYLKSNRAKLAVYGEKSAAKRVYMADIKVVICAYFRISETELLSVTRNKQIVVARHLCMYFARKYTTLGFPHIGRILGNADHTTAMFGHKKITMAVDSPSKDDDHVIKGWVQELGWIFEVKAE